MYAGVYLSLKRRIYPHNSVILITEIGETDGLQCITDKMSCCGSAALGGWQDPDGTNIPTRATATSFYTSRGDDGTVNLNRPNSVTMPAGRFCCVVPDAASTVVTLCAIVGKNFVHKTV